MGRISFREIFEEITLTEMGLIDQLKGKSEKESIDYLKQKYGMTDKQIQKVLNDKKIREEK